VVFLEKRERPLGMEEQQLRFDEERTEEDENYQVYIARVDNIGYDATGRPTVAENQASEPPEISDTISDFAKRLGW